MGWNVILSFNEIKERCDRIFNAKSIANSLDDFSDKSAQAKFSIQIYLACSHFFGDITEKQFVMLINYYHEKFGGGA